MTIRLRVLLIMPTYYFDAAERQSYSHLPPMGLGYLASVLRNEGCKVQIFDIMGREGEITHRINRFNPDLIGVSCLTSFYPSFARTIRRVRQTYNGQLVAGGPHFAFKDEAIKSLNQLPIDAIVMGEGEHSIPKVLDDMPNPKQIYISNPIEDLDSLPFPAWDLFEMKKYNGHKIQVHTSRGCPYNCIYCSSRNVWGGKVRFRSPDNVVEEMDELYRQYGFRTFFFTDDTFVLDSRRVKHFADLLENRNYRFQCNGRINLMNDDLLANLRRGGCFEVDYGVETFVQRVADIIKKHINVCMIDEVVKKTRAYGLDVKLYMMLSLPSETLDDMRISLKKAEALHEKYDCAIDFQLCRIYPGTPLSMKVGLSIDNWEKKIHDLRYPNLPIYLEHPLATIFCLGGKWLRSERGAAFSFRDGVLPVIRETMRKPTAIKRYIRRYLGRFQRKICSRA